MNSNRNNRFERLESCGSSTIRTSSLSTSTSTLSDDSDDSTVPTVPNSTNITLVPNNQCIMLNNNTTNAAPSCLPLSVQALSESLAAQKMLQQSSSDRTNRPPEISVTVEPMPNQSGSESIAPPTPSRFTVQVGTFSFLCYVNISRLEY